MDFFLVSSGAEIRPLSQWDLGDFFPNLKKKFSISNITKYRILNIGKCMEMDVKFAEGRVH